MVEREYSVNNTKLYAFTNENLNSFCISFIVRAGSIFENDDNNGISHLLEHTVFRNIKKKYPDEFYDLLSLNGLVFGACTYREFMRFSISGPAFGFNFACEVICSIMDELSISNKEYILEKKRIKAECREKNNLHSIGNFFMRNIWIDTNNEKTILGYCKNIDKITLSQLEQYRRKMFCGQNVFFYVTGCVSDSEIEQLISKINEYDIEKDGERMKNEIILSKNIYNRECNVKIRESSYYSALFGFDVDSKKYSGAVCDILYDVLFLGDNALIYKYISEDNPITYSYDSTLEQYDNVANIHFDFEFNSNKAIESINCVIDALNDLKQGRFNFEANMRYELAKWITILDDPDELAWNLAYYNHILDTERVDYSADKFSRFKDVTKEQVIKAAQEIFTTKNLTLVLEGKKSKLKLDKIAEALKRLDENIC